ncbi:serine/threonine-protein kinase [Kitasatospora sp. LaBMicrA B282]|uniref:serine/threonine-protein kinase n=1 Tax=Kitasatospora sp. LaBMicrA B282 TaxID=3420949 RepID=UPI003D133253
MNALTDGGAAEPDDRRPWTLPGYTHERELGSGGSGWVALARHEATGTRVAIKYLSPAVGDTSGLRSEAALLGGLHSPHVAALYEYVEGPQGAAIVMELVDGLALRALLRQEGATTPEAALVVLKGSLLGLAAAHAAGVVHRDYKPENVLIAVDGSSKLVDFGIAARTGESAQLAGTPVYMAPEQWAGEPASPSADVYAATATFFECLTGAKPYSGTTLAELAVQHTEAPIPDDLAPEPVRPLIRAGLAKTPGQRPAGAAELVEELERVAVAGYGADWEERGRRTLAALVALLPLLLPSAGGAGTGGTALATTVLGAPDPSPAGWSRPLKLGRRGRLVAGAVGIAVLGCTLGRFAMVDGFDGATAANVLPAPGPQITTSLGPGQPAPSVTASATVSVSASVSASGSPSASASVSASASASASSSGSPSASATATGPAGAAATTRATGSAASGGAATTAAAGGGGGPVGGTGGAPGGGGPGPSTGASGPATPPSTGGTGSSPSTSPTSSAPSTPAPTLRVLSVSIDSYGCYGLYGTTAKVTVQTDGAADGVLTLSWLDAGNATPVGVDHIVLPKGQRTVSGTYTHTFGAGDRAADWGVRVATDPAATRGQNGFQQVPSYYCNPPR